MPIFPIRGTGANSAPVSIEASRDAFSYPTSAPVYAAASAASSPAAAPAVDAAPADDSMSAEEFNEELLREGEGEEELAISAARMRAEAELAEGDAVEAEDPANAENAEVIFGSGGSFPMDMPAAASRISDAAVPTQYVPTPAAQPSAAPTAQASSPSPNASYCFPPLSLLKPSDHRGGSTDEEIKRIASSLLETLESFNVSASVSHVSRGPRITRYELIPKRGVRIRNIVNLQDDISMNLASAGIRIEAPIPGLAAVGVEVPNKVPTAVRLRDMLDHENFRSASSKTTICVGSDVTGEPVYGDVAKMPHVLIAGATGMGKSVCINAILLSLLFKAHPDEVKLILVDPKKVELNVYNGIPHLLVPVVVEPQKAAGALVWAVGEMERRFNMIETHSVRDIKGYNRIMKEHPELGKPLPQIVIVIDELNDLMMSARDAVEDAICRIAQKARAAGIHLLIGTQRPSVDVITGVIKANIPSRIAFHVSSQVDSRTILDMSGAEKLLNNGDMLFYPVGVPKPIRVQGAFVEDEEVEAVTSFLKRGVDASAIYDDEVMANIEREAEKCMPKDKRGERGESDGDSGDRDDLFSDPQFISAVEIAISQGQISTSKLQSKMRIGFQKATFFVDNMEEMGIVGPLNGAKPREVLISMAQFLEMKARH
jgi:S-DNA-T family DNA segregation ATPase FtsK/SpoIIIE